MAAPSTGTLTGHRSPAGDPGGSGGKMSSDVAASPGAGVLGDLAGWEGRTAPFPCTPRSGAHHGPSQLAPERYKSAS